MVLEQAGRARRLEHSAIAIASCAALLFSSACFGGQSPQPTGTSAQAAATTPPPAPPRPSPSPLASPSPSPEPAAAGATYTVGEGDTLVTISQKVYGDGTLWRKIYDANKGLIGENPDSIKAGSELKIPPKD